MFCGCVAQGDLWDLQTDLELGLQLLTKLRCHPPDRMYPLELVHFRQTIFYSLTYSVNIIIAECLELPPVSLGGVPSESLYKQLGINIIAHHSTAAPLHRSQSADNVPTFL